MTAVLSIRDMRIAVGSHPDNRFELDVPALDLQAGRYVAAVGPSGCGKSTFLEVIALLRRPERLRTFQLYLGPDRGSLDLGAGTDWTHLRRGPIGYIPQSGGVLPFLTARDHVHAPLRMAGADRPPQAEHRLRLLSRDLEIEPHLGKRRAELSGGQRKRVALLAGLSLPRRLLIADEPTAGLDAKMAKRVLQTLAGIAEREGTAVVIATHDVEIAQGAGFDLLSITDRVVRPVASEERAHA